MVGLELVVIVVVSYKMNFFIKFFFVFEDDCVQGEDKEGIVIDCCYVILIVVEGFEVVGGVKKFSVGFDLFQWE